jgi:hypothetical protein
MSEHTTSYVERVRQAARAVEEAAERLAHSAGIRAVSESASGGASMRADAQALRRALLAYERVMP